MPEVTVPDFNFVQQRLLCDLIDEAFKIRDFFVKRKQPGSVDCQYFGITCRLNAFRRNHPVVETFQDRAKLIFLEKEMGH